MARNWMTCPLLVAVSLFLVSPISALEKVKLGSSVKTDPGYYLPVSAADEKGFWKDNGLEVEWVPFGGGVPHMHAIAAGAISIGLTSNDTPPKAAERGLPVIMVAELTVRPFFLWVRTDSPYRHPRDLKGARFGVSGLGGTEHSFARIILAAYGIEKDVKFAGSGGTPNTMAGMKAGVFDASVLTMGSAIGLKAEGTIREIASSHDYLPKPWFDHVVFARKDFLASKPEVARNMLKATIQAADFIRKNPAWTINKIKGFHRVPEEAAKLVYDSVQFTTTGKIDRKAVENVRKILMEYGILTEKTPPAEALFTNDYLPN